MARSGTPSRVTDAEAAPTPVRAALVDAAIASLREDGFAGASARSIARRAGCNQGLVFYHFGSVANLLLAALDETSRRRMSRYRAAVAGAESPGALVDVAAAIFAEDLDAGHMAVLAEMLAGARSTPGLGTAVAARVAPWITFTEEAVAGVAGGGAAAGVLGGLVGAGDLAYAIAALYLGLEMLAQLDDGSGAGGSGSVGGGSGSVGGGGGRARAEALFGAARRVAALFETGPGAGAAPDPARSRGAGEGAPGEDEEHHTSERTGA